MIEFLKVLLLAKMVVLTPAPLDVNPGTFELELREPVSAITDGASIYIDVSSMAHKGVRDVLSAREWVERDFGDQVLVAEMVAVNMQERAVFRFRGKSSWSEGRSYLILSSESGVPVGKQYNKVVMETNAPLRNVSLIWRNYSK